MKKLLVTGAAGFIGSNFAHYWHANNPGDSIVALDALTYAGNRHNLTALMGKDQFKFVKGNICDLALIESLLTEHDIDTLVHFAAESHVDRSISGPDAFIQTNILGTHTLLKAAKKHWIDGPGKACGLFHHVSTDEVYGSLNASDNAFIEVTPYAPNSPYAASKAASDHLVRAYHKTYGLNVTTSNCSNNYGPFHFPEKLIPLCLLNILQGNSLPIYGNGKQIRDWLYVEDHCKAIELIIDKGKRGETYNIGGNNSMTNIELVTLLCEIINQRFESNPEMKQCYPNSPCSNDLRAESLITYVQDRPGHDERYAVDISKISAELGFHPRDSFISGLNKTVDWYLENREWWMSVLDGTYRDDNLI